MAPHGIFIVDKELLQSGRKKRRSWTGNVRNRTLYGVGISPTCDTIPNHSTRFQSSRYQSIHDPKCHQTRPHPSGNADSHKDSAIPGYLKRYSIPTRTLFNYIDEDIIIMQSCNELLIDHPAIWQSNINLIYGVVPTRYTGDSSFAMMERSSQLALATSTLVTFRPVKFPKRLCYKYTSTAVAEVHRYIATGRYRYDALLQAITNLVLAATLLSDGSSARIHLAAAKGLIAKLGGLIAVNHHTAALLSYCDIHIAAEHASRPFLRDVGLSEKLILPDTSSLWPEVLTCTQSIKESTYNSSLPENIVQAIDRFTDSAVALIVGLTSSVITRTELQHIVTTLASLLGLLSMEQPSCDFTSRNANHVRTPKPCVELDISVILFFWSQLLMCCIAGLTASASIRNNICPMSNASALEHTSTAVKDGIRRWNLEVEASRSAYSQTATDDWLRLVDIVASMETGQPISISLLMEHLLHARSRCQRQSPTIGHSFGNWIYCFHTAVDESGQTYFG